MEKQIYLIRHGETDLNKQNIVQGRGVNSDLNQTGIAQADAFYKAYQHIQFQKIFISSLKRTYQSVQNFVQKDQIPYEVFEGLDELAWGIWEGKQVSQQSNLVFRKILSKWLAGDINARFEGGESPKEVCFRQEPVIGRIKDEPVANLLICMHGRAMRMLLCQLLELPISSMDKFTHSNLTLYRLKFDGSKFHLLEADNTDHLKYYLTK